MVTIILQLFSWSTVHLKQQEELNVFIWKDRDRNRLKEEKNKKAN